MNWPKLGQVGRYNPPEITLRIDLRHHADYGYSYSWLGLQFDHDRVAQLGAAPPMPLYRALLGMYNVHVRIPVLIAKEAEPQGSGVCIGKEMTVLLSISNGLWRAI